MTIDEKIALVCQGVEGLTYHYNDWTKANVEFDNIRFPVLLNLLPADGEFTVRNGQLRDKPNGMFAFLDLTDFDENATENSTVVARMKDAARRFIAAVNESGLFVQIEGTFRYQVVYDKLDVNVTGVVLPLTLSERIGVCL